jgi:hypothetical protein
LIEANRTKPVYPDVADMRHAASPTAAVFCNYFDAKSRHNVDATMRFFAPDLLTYTDSTWGWPVDGYDALKSLFDSHMPKWPASGLSYPVRVLGGPESALVEFIDKRNCSAPNSGSLALWISRTGKSSAGWTTGTATPSTPLWTVRCEPPRPSFPLSTRTMRLVNTPRVASAMLYVACTTRSPGTMLPLPPAYSAMSQCSKTGRCAPDSWPRGDRSLPGACSGAAAIRIWGSRSAHRRRGSRRRLRMDIIQL